MALFPQFPYSNLHELNLDWLIEQISQLMENGTVISVNGMSGIVTLYTDKDVVFPDLAFDPDWSVYRKIADKQAGLKFTGEKFYYITKNTTDEDFNVQEVFTSSNPPPYPVTSVNGETGNVVIAVPVTSVNGRTGNVVLAGDNIPYNIDGSYTIEDVIIPLEKSIGHVIRYNKCSDGVTAGQYVYLIMSGISGRSDGLYRAVNNKSAGTVWTSADLSPVAGGLGALMASNDSAISELNSNITNINGNINNTKLGDFSSKSDLDTLLDTALSGMITNGRKTFRVTCNGSFGLFKTGWNYFCTLNKEGTSNTYSSVTMVESGGVNTYQGARNESGWTYFQINNTGMKYFWIDDGESITYKNNGHLTFFMTASSNSNGMIALVTTTGSAIAIAGSLPNSISVSSSGSGEERTITITNNVGWGIPVWVML